MHEVFAFGSGSVIAPCVMGCIEVTPHDQGVLARLAAGCSEQSSELLTIVFGVTVDVDYVESERTAFSGDYLKAGVFALALSAFVELVFYGSQAFPHEGTHAPSARRVGVGLVSR